MTVAHRHTHSPRVRRLARDHGVVLGGMAGSGPRGRVTPGDVLDAAGRVEPAGRIRSAATVPVAPEPVTGGSSGVAAPVARAGVTTAVVEVDVTRLPATPHELLAAIIEAALTALRQAAPHPEPGVGVDVVVHADDGPVTVPDAHLLTRAALRNALASPPGPSRPAGAGPRGAAPEALMLAVHDAGACGLLVETPPLAAGELAALSVGAVVDRVVVVDADGGRGFGVRSLVQVALAYDERLPRAAAVQVLAAVRTRLEGGGS
ncbi:E3 binding domain-containing protein [Oryzobacter telluris]|uniref:E3 binding domain-containing protein n=1 Tax=Oryzobacter telluris TaxID=3149179 RepID=UPI00370DA98D